MCALVTGVQTCALPSYRLAVDLEIGRRNAPTAIDQREVERLAFGKAGQPRLLDRGDVNEHILGAIITDDEAERSEERRVGKECVRTGRSRGSRYHDKTKI